eukprot:GDKI01043377.1.p1 GENE.GDKI01043377.1~~GDKI01043377.1.p1  ORF type:complete len:322 (-),score=74.43 GDKI01043377.1:41-913(-)
MGCSVSVSKPNTNLLRSTPTTAPNSNQNSNIDCSPTSTAENKRQIPPIPAVLNGTRALKYRTHVHFAEKNNQQGETCSSNADKSVIKDASANELTMPNTLFVRSTQINSAETHHVNEPDKTPAANDTTAVGVGVRGVKSASKTAYCESVFTDNRLCDVEFPILETVRKKTVEVLTEMGVEKEEGVKKFRFGIAGANKKDTHTSAMRTRLAEYKQSDTFVAETCVCVALYSTGVAENAQCVCEYLTDFYTREKRIERCMSGVGGGEEGGKREVDGVGEREKYCVFVCVDMS